MTWIVSAADSCINTGGVHQAKNVKQKKWHSFSKLSLKTSEFRPSSFPIQTFHHEKEHFRRHQHETEQQRRRLPPHQRQQQQTAPFELSPILRPDTLFTTSTPTLAEEEAHHVAGHEGRQQPGSQLIPGDHAAASADPTLPSPASAVASLTRDLEQSLSLQSAMRGQFVVKPQVTRAECPNVDGWWCTHTPLCLSPPSPTLHCLVSLHV